MVVGTSHLESPIPPFNGPALMSGPRKAQLAQALRWCEAAAAEPTESALFAGDMNWNDSNDGAMSLGGWTDAWVTLRPSDKGFTFDTTVNKMLTFKLRVRTGHAERYGVGRVCIALSSERRRGGGGTRSGGRMTFSLCRSVRCRLGWTACCASCPGGERRRLR